MRFHLTSSDFIQFATPSQRSFDRLRLEPRSCARQAMLSRYAQRCAPKTVQGLRDALTELGHDIPDDDEAVKQDACLTRLSK